MARSPNLLFVFSNQQRYSALGANADPSAGRSGGRGDGLRPGVFQSSLALSVSSPYRAMLIFGCYAWQNGVIDNEYRLHPELPTLPGPVREHGYATAHIATWHLG